MPVPPSLQAENQSVPGSPKAIVPGCSVPKSGYQESNKQVQIWNAGLAAANRNINIVTQPVGQRNMPPSPEFRQRKGNIRIIKILLKVKAEHLGKSDRHICVAAEIKIKLQCITNNTEPGESRRIISRSENIMRNDADLVSEKNFFCQTDRESSDALRKSLDRYLGTLELPGYITVPNNRTFNDFHKE